MKSATAPSRRVPRPAGPPAAERGLTPERGVRRAGHTSGARLVAQLYLRLVRRSSLLLAVAATAYLAVEVLAFEAAYPDPAARATLVRMADNPAVRMLQGVPHGIENTGAYVAWDAGWMILTIVAVWAAVVTTRLLRGEEDTDRAALVLAGPVSAGRAVAAQLGVLLAVAGAVGAVCATAMIACGTAPAGALLFGAGIAGFAATFTGVAAVAAQLAPTRRRALGGTAGVLGAVYLLRMIAYSSDSRDGVKWFSPYCWVDELRPFDANRVAPLALLFGAAAVTTTIAVILRVRRDTGAALLRSRDAGRARMGLLGSPVAFAWRLNLGVLAGWLTGLACYALVIGTISPVATELIRDDPDYQQMLERFGMQMAGTERGFIAMMGPSLGLVMAMYACWRIGAARAEEAAGHVETMLAQPVTRRQWLGGHVALTVVGTALLALAAGLTAWLGTRIAGADVGLADTVATTTAQAPLVLAFTGVAVLLFGLVPRLTTTLPVAVVVMAYLLSMLGPALRLPDAVIALSPFDHLGYVPVDHLRVGACLVMVAGGALAAGIGGIAFARRDLTGG